MPESAPHGQADQHEIRLRQQSLVAEFGLFALAQDEIGLIFHEACRVAANGLGTRFAKLMVFNESANDFLVIAGFGWEPGVVGHARIPADLGSAAGYAFKTGQAVISNELTLEDRFYTPQLLVDYGITRAINVIVRNQGEAFGVLEVDSARDISFYPLDLSFVQSVANTVAAVAERERARAAQRQSEALAASVLQASSDCINVLDGDGRITFMNEAGLRLLGRGALGDLDGRAWAEFWPDDERATIRASIERARSGESVRFEAFCPARNGSARWWDVSLSTIPGTDGPHSRFVSISRDATGRIEAEAALREALADKDLLIQEVHHRVKNSLQLVQTFLNLQARAAAEPEVKAQLRDAASRVVTVSAVHDRLYRGGSVSEGDAEAYLTGLLDDLRAAVPGDSKGREMTLRSEALILPAQQLTQLGLVMTELVTNAIKYGRGRIGVELRTTTQGAELTINDEGDGFAADFDPLHSGGLGMRLIYAMAKSGSDALLIDRGVRHGRVTCRLTLAQAGIERA